MRTVEDAGPYKTNLNFVRKQTSKQEFIIDHRFLIKEHAATENKEGNLLISLRKSRRRR